jgi:hypothetical protein
MQTMMGMMVKRWFLLTQTLGGGQWSAANSGALYPLEQSPVRVGYAAVWPKSRSGHFREGKIAWAVITLPFNPLPYKRTERAILAFGAVCSVSLQVRSRTVKIRVALSSETSVPINQVTRLHIGEEINFTIATIKVPQMLRISGLRDKWSPIFFWKEIELSHQCLCNRRP